MLTNTSLLGYFTNAGPVVKFVMLLLLAASVMSWALIFQRGMLISQARKAMAFFEQKFWSCYDVTKLYNELAADHENLSGLEYIFVSGFKEYARLSKQSGVQPALVLESAQRAMRIAIAQELDQIEQNLPLLATIGSISPYVGLFGTVWGIMTSFHALGNVSQATIGLVAPGISEALIATAMGLFAAIPAVIAYNRYSSNVERLMNQYDTFQDEFSTVLNRLALTGSAS